jgi:tetratricopeptide (TPR) repeat protein
VSNVLSRHFLPPANWQDFEQLCYDLFRRLWRDQGTELHGRRGQPQAGVDAYGENKDDNKLCGVRCKGKNGAYGAAVTKKELIAEIEKAKKFKPPLDRFILVTTAPNDAIIQATSREITETHRNAGLFDVEVKGWDNLKQLITDFPEIVKKYFSDLAPVDLVISIESGHEVVRAEGRQTRQLLDPIGEKQDRLLEGLARLEAREMTDSVDILQIKIKQVSSLVEDGDAKAALRGLQRLKAENWDAASSRNWYCLLAAIASATLTLDRLAEGIAILKEAYAQDPEHPGAKALLATAQVLDGNHGQALTLARDVLSIDPSSEQSALVLIEAAPVEMKVDEVRSLIPQQLRRNLTIILGLCLHAQAHGDHAEARALAEEAYCRDQESWHT